MDEDLQKPIVVMSNGQGGCIDVNFEEPDQCTIILKQGSRHAALVGDLELLMETGLKAGQEVRNGRIIVKDSLEPYEPDDPLFLLKKRNGKICYKNGKAIYSHSYFTYDKKDQDELIEEDKLI